MNQADHALLRGTNIALRCWEIRNELGAFGVGGQRGRWVPLPADSPPDQAPLDSTAAAHHTSGEMVAMVRARDVHAHNLPSTRALGQGTSTDASAVPAVLGMQAEAPSRRVRST